MLSLDELRLLAAKYRAAKFKKAAADCRNSEKNMQIKKAAQLLDDWINSEFGLVVLELLDAHEGDIFITADKDIESHPHSHKRYGISAKGFYQHQPDSDYTYYGSSREHLAEIIVRSAISEGGSLPDKDPMEVVTFVAGLVEERINLLISEAPQ